MSKQDKAASKGAVPAAKPAQSKPNCCGDKKK